MSPGASTAFRCSEASTGSLAGTASTVRAFLLVEAPGAWGVDAVQASRIPADLRAWLGGLTGRHRVRPLMIRRHGRQGRHADRGGTRVFAAYVGEDGPFVETAVLHEPGAVSEVDVAGLAAGVRPGLTPYEEPLFAVCTHGKHDACCAEKGRPLCAAMHQADPEHTWEVSHIGGDRFAPNLLLLPDGLYYGRLDPADAAAFVEAHRAGELSLPHLRGRCAFPFAVQAAEIYLREHLRLRRRTPPRLVSADRDGEETRTVLDVDGAAWEVRTRSRHGAPQQLTCRALTESTPLEHSLVGIAPLPA